MITLEVQCPQAIYLAGALIDLITVSVTMSSLDLLLRHNLHSVQ